jgi:predicted nucleic acid-binding protein
MILFFDTSALVKLFNTEAGSDEVKKLITNSSNEVYVLELALTEIYSALYRKFRNKEIPEEKLERVHVAIAQQFESFSIIPLASDIIEESVNLIKKFGKESGLRTLDSIHVAGWKLMAEAEWQFVSADKNQLQVVKEMNYKIISV